MANYYSISILVQDSAPLDGTSPLPSTAKVTRKRSEIVEVEIPAGSPYGLFDPGEVVNLQNKDFLVVSATVISDGAPVHAAGSELRIVSPEVGGSPREQQIRDLSGVPGIFPVFGEVVPIDHKIALDTVADGPASGPHRIELTLVSLDRENAAQVGSQLAIAAASVAPPPTDLVYSVAVQSAPGTATPALNEIARYDATGLAPGDITIQAPPAPTINDRFAVKEVGNSPVAVTIDGNGNDIESPGAPPAPTYALTIARANLIFQYDGASWRIL